jgi:hypothetical protein
MDQTLLEKQKGDTVLDIILTARNDLIKDFLDERYLRAHFATRFSIQELSNRKVEFIKKSLMEKLHEPLDEKHYQRLIDDLRDSGLSEITEGEDQLIHKDLEMIFRNYTF